MNAVKYISLAPSTPQTVLADLAKHGVAIVHGVLSDPSAYEAKLTAELAKFGVANGDDLAKFFPLHSMLIQHYSIGHFQTSWDVRASDGVRQVFAAIHGTDDLLTSFDGLSVHFPPESRKKKGAGKYRNNNWLHTDQAFLSTDLHPDGTTRLSIQGLVNLRHVAEGDATFMCIPSTHLLHKDFGTTFGLSNHKDNWYKINSDEQLNWLITNAAKLYTEVDPDRALDRAPQMTGLVALTAPAGSMILWDSRTFHQGKEANGDRALPNTRMAIYTCLTPRLWATQKELLKKRTAFNNKRTTGHLPHIITNNLFPRLPRT
jgi:hypothetical protein